jgi:hypothetical protein
VKIMGNSCMKRNHRLIRFKEYDIDFLLNNTYFNKHEIKKWYTSFIVSIRSSICSLVFHILICSFYRNNAQMVFTLFGVEVLFTIFFC